MMHSSILALGLVFSLVESASGETLSDNSKSMEAHFFQDVNYEPDEEEGFWGRELGKSNDSRRMLGEGNINTQLFESAEDDVNAVLNNFIDTISKKDKEEDNFWGRELGRSNDRKLLRKRIPSRKMDMVINNKAESTMNQETAHFWGRELGGSNRRRLDNKDESFWGRELGKSNDRRNLSEQETGNFWGRELGESSDSRRMLRKSVNIPVEPENKITIEKEIEYENFWERELGLSGRDLRGGYGPLQEIEDFTDLFHDEINEKDFWKRALEQ